MKPWRAVRRPTHQIPAGAGCPARTWCACSAIVQHNAIRVFFEKGAAYKNAMERARENELRSVGFCILSAGIFRGGCPLKVVIETGLETIAKTPASRPSSSAGSRRRSRLSSPISRPPSRRRIV